MYVHRLPNDLESWKFPWKGNPLARPFLKMENRKFILVLSCPDRVGIVAKVASFLAEQHANILELAQFGDETTGRLFMRCFFEFQQTIPSREAFEEKFKPIVRELSLEWSFYPFKEKLRSVILVSKEAHCLNDLLHRTRHSDFPIDVIRIFSNHASLQDMAAWYNVPFQHAPISPGDQARSGREASRFCAGRKNRSCDSGSIYADPICRFH